MSVYNFDVTTIDGKLANLLSFKGRVLLIVNVASACGFTPQYRQLEELQVRYGQHGLSILGFPCNQFGGQEPGRNTDIQQFCEVRYGVSFQLFSKINVNGKNAHPLFDWLKREAPGILGSQSIKWNFTKFLVQRDGLNVKRYGTRIQPRSLVGPIKKALF